MKILTSNFSDINQGPEKVQYDPVEANIFSPPFLSVTNEPLWQHLGYLQNKTPIVLPVCLEGVECRWADSSLHASLLQFVPNISSQSFSEMKHVCSSSTYICRGSSWIVILSRIYLLKLPFSSPAAQHLDRSEGRKHWEPVKALLVAVVEITWRINRINSGNVSKSWLTVCSLNLGW